MPALLLSIVTPLFVPSPISWSYFIFLFPCSSVGGNTCARVPHFLLPYCLVFPFSLFGAGENEYARRTLLLALLLKWPLKPLNKILIVILNCTSCFPAVLLKVRRDNPLRYGRNTNALVSLYH